MKSLKFLIVLMLPTTLFGQWEYIHPSAGDSEFVTAVSLEHSLVLGGNITEKYGFTPHGLLVEVNADGDTLWTYSWTGDEESQVVDLVAMENSFMVLLRENRKASVAWFDAGRKLQWVQKASPLEQPIGLLKEPNDAFVVLGVGESAKEPEKDAIYIQSLTSTGKLKNSAELFTGERLKPYAMAFSNEGELVISGTERTPAGQEAFLWTFSKNRKKMNRSSLSEAGIKYPFDLKVDSDGTILVGGEDLEGLACLAKLNADGDVIWKKSLSGTSGNFRMYSIALGSDGSILAGGRTNEAKAFLAQFDKEGTLIMEKQYEGKGKAGFKSVLVEGEQWSAAGATLGSRAKSSGYLIQIKK